MKSAPALPEDAGIVRAAARRYQGRVLDASHKPVPVFRVGEVEVQGPDGRFVLLLRPVGDTVAFTVEAPALATANVVRPADREFLGDIVLQPAPTVRGVVREADGRPAAGCLVICQGCRGDGEDGQHLTALTDGEGRFVLAVTGAYGVLFRLLALKEGRLAWAEAGRVGEEAQLTLAGPVRVAGRVVRADGESAAGVAVVFSEPLLDPVRLVSLGDGSFAGEVPPGLYRVTLEPDTSFPRRTWTVEVPPGHPLEFSTGVAP